MVSKAELQKWVDYANKVGAIILYDAAYEAYISEKDIPHSIYECEGARTCAIEMRSFSKNAGFTGMRLGFTVIPKDIKSGDVTLHSCGHAVTERNTTELRTSSREPARLFTLRKEKHS